MLRRLLDLSLAKTAPGKPLHLFYPLVSAIDSFCFEPLLNTKTRPYVRDAIDLKRWMVLVIVALLPTIFMAIWNGGLQKWVYESGSAELMKEFLPPRAHLRAILNLSCEMATTWRFSKRAPSPSCLL